MKIVVIGDGKVGYVLTKMLSQEGHDVVVVDRNAEILHEAQDKLDVAVVTGNGASVEVQRVAGTADADLMVAATSSDETNLLCSLVARKLGCRNIIARVRNPEYDEQINLLKSDFGLSFSINPEKTAAREIFRLLQFPSFLKRDSFAGGRAEIVGIKLSEKSPLVGRRLDQLGDVLKLKILICSVDRGAEVIIPSGGFELRAGDKLTVAAAAADLSELIRVMGIKTQKIERVMIIGGGTSAAYLAKLLIQARVSVTIIERSRPRCEVLCDLLPQANIINGDGTTQSLLLDEGIREADAVVTLTGMDEENLLVSMFANYLGVPKTITKINRLEYTEVFSGMGIDTIVSPKLLTANEIVRYARAIGESPEGSIEILYRLHDGRAEALGFTVPENAAFIGVPLSQLPLRPNVLVASIVRAQRVIVPKGDDFMLAGDSVVVIANAQEAIANLTDIFLDNEGRAR